MKSEEELENRLMPRQTEAQEPTVEQKDRKSASSKGVFDRLSAAAPCERFMRRGNQARAAHVEENLPK